MTHSPAHILVIDDEEIIREALDALLTMDGCVVRTAATGAEGLALLAEEDFDTVLLDLMLPDRSGLEVLDEIRKGDEGLPVVMITAFGTIDTAVRATKQGAFHYFTKPFKNDEVLVVLRNAVERRRLERENLELRNRLKSGSHRFDQLIGGSARMKTLFDLISRAAPSRTTMLIQGESGTGKELVAQACHRHSARSDKAFVTVNSGNLPPDLLESLLFGHVKGAFTGAVATKKGLFEMADRGTIFFDEIGNVPLETQAKLLRVIQEREFMRLGGVDTIKVDVRIIAATNVELRKSVAEGRFREDLFYRLNVIPVQMPALRDRKDDIPLLVQHFLEKHSEESRKSGWFVTPDALDLLTAYDWPGNVRELENVIERAVVLSPSREIGIDLVPDQVRFNREFKETDFVVPPEGIPLREVLSNAERRWIESALEAAGGVQKKAAELLFIKPTTLNEMIKRYDIRPRRRKPEFDNGSASGAPPGDDVG
ncbi:MAG: sigma-54-dependent Fis family transcriptional regulator [Acidobacteria bacterium]|nr:sigma-54-dependent Fis family transcriptional regulator [Acidobacteriota bacterium]